MKPKIPFSVFVALIPGLIVVSFTFFFMNLSEIFSWIMERLNWEVSHTISVFIALTLLGAGILLSLGLFFISRVEEWHQEREAREKAKVRRGSHNALTDAINSMDNSVDRLRAVSRAMNAQTKIIERIDRNYQNSDLTVQPSLRIVHPLSTGSSTMPAGSIFRNSGNRKTTFTETEAIFIFLNQLKLKEEFHCFDRPRKYGEDT